jgi:hypothetical protein
MCHYITAALPASTDIAALTAIADRHGRGLRALSNPSIQQQLKAGENYFLTTTGHCDCGTPLGAHAATAADDTHAQIRKLRLKGWSETKIARWNEQRGEHQAQKTAADRIAAEAGIAEWQAFLAAALARNDTPYICLLLHMYDGALDRDMELSARQTVKLREADTVFLGAMSEDVLYEFRA